MKLAANNFYYTSTCLSFLHLRTSRSLLYVNSGGLLVLKCYSGLCPIMAVYNCIPGTRLAPLLGTVLANISPLQSHVLDSILTTEHGPLITTKLVESGWFNEINYHNCYIQTQFVYLVAAWLGISVTVHQRQPQIVYGMGTGVWIDDSFSFALYIVSHSHLFPLLLILLDFGLCTCKEIVRVQFLVSRPTYLATRAREVVGA